MRKHVRFALAFWLISGSAVWAQSPPVNSDAKLMVTFKEKVDEYVKLRDKLDSPKLKNTDDPKVLIESQKALAAKIRAARAQAVRGEFFSPATEAQFRRFISPTLKGAEGQETKAAIKDDAPEAAVIPFKVNADYPRDESLSTVPADVLRSLPTLPEDVQYRFAGRHLLLYDARANMILDFMLNALPADMTPPVKH